MLTARVGASFPSRCPACVRATPHLPLHSRWIGSRRLAVEVSKLDPAAASAKEAAARASGAGGSDDGDDRHGVGGSGNRGGGGGPGRNGKGGDGPGRGSVPSLLGLAVLLYPALLTAAAAVWDAITEASIAPYDTHAATVSVIIPALNEERAIADTVRHALYELQPTPCEVLVVDGGSSDGTVEAARRACARVITSGGRGRALQMNAGAAAAQGELLLFLHADTRLPHDAVESVRGALAAPRTVLVGFRPRIEDGGRALWFSSLNNLTKTWYGPMLLRPASFVRGLRCLFGDQALCCRATDFRSVGGFRADYPIMEDAELCIALHMSGPSDKTRLRHTGRGRVKMLPGGPAVTSGRRIVAWGELRANLVFAYISLLWLAGATPTRLHQTYRSLYGDVR